MRRSLTPFLIVVLVLQLALALVLFMRRDPLAGTRSDTPLVRAESVKGADQIVIESKSAESTRIVLKKKEGTWVLPDAYDAPAASARVSSLLDRLVALKRGLPIATSESALRRFKVVDGDFERRLVLRAGDRLLGDLKDHPDNVMAALDVITETVIRYVAAVAQVGADGIFYASQDASRDVLDEGEHARFSMPYSRRVLESLNGSTLFTMLHLHGENIYFDRKATLPVAAVNALAMAATVGPWEASPAPSGFSSGRSISSTCTCGTSGMVRIG